MIRFLMLSALAAGGCSSPPHAAVEWQPWSEDVFKAATREEKLVLLDLGAVWCHWCHVMDRETYGDPAVAATIREHFIPVHVNQDERPDLANRYEDYGWPATVIFGPDGKELVKFRGYIPPARMLSLLKGVVADPTPGPSAFDRGTVAAAASPVLGEDLDGGLHRAWEAAYDRTHQGWGDVHKYLDPDCVELAIAEGRDDLARPTLDAMLGLVDPVWGGVYQYSHGGVWTNPHFEKIMSFQAEDMRIYSLAWRVYRDERYLRAARDVERYMLGFLRSPEGAFYASQDADPVPGEHGGDYFMLDDAGRRARGLPRVDTHFYTRENGWAIAGLAHLYRATGDAATLAAAVTAANWILAHRSLTGGGFRHEERDAAGPYLADNLATARAFFELHQATLDPAWLESAAATMEFIEKRFRAPVGFLTAVPAPGDEGKAWAPRPQTDENIGIARLALGLAHATGVETWRKTAEHAMRYLAAAAESANGVRAAGILLAARELAREPVTVHFTGRRADPRLTTLLAAALQAPAPFIVFSHESEAGDPAAGSCLDGACFAPTADAAELARLLRPSRSR
jgi:hypothetical protein